MVDAAVRSLHGEHPVEIVLDFGKQIWEGAFGRDVPLERLEILREVFVKREERVGRDARVHNVTTVVASIVPALAGIDRTRSTRRIVKFSSRIRVAGCAGPLACILAFESHGSALVVEPLDGSLDDIFVRLGFHDEVGTEHIAVYLDAVLARFGKLGEIDELDILTARIPVRCGLRRHGENDLAGCIHEIHAAVSIDKSEFLEVARTVANLVDVGSRCESWGCNERGKRYGL